MPTKKSKPPVKFEPPDNPVVKEREDDAPVEAESGAKETAPKDDTSTTIPITTKTAKTEFTIVNH